MGALYLHSLALLHFCSFSCPFLFLDGPGRVGISGPAEPEGKGPRQQFRISASTPQVLDAPSTDLLSGISWPSVIIVGSTGDWGDSLVDLFVTTFSGKEPVPVQGTRYSSGASAYFLSLCFARSLRPAQLQVPSPAFWRLPTACEKGAAAHRLGKIGCIPDRFPGTLHICCHLVH